MLLATTTEKALNVDGLVDAVLVHRLSVIRLCADHGAATPRGEEGGGETAHVQWVVESQILVQA